MVGTVDALWGGADCVWGHASNRPRLRNKYYGYLSRKQSMQNNIFHWYCSTKSDENSVWLATGTNYIADTFAVEAKHTANRAPSMKHVFNMHVFVCIILFRIRILYIALNCPLIINIEILCILLMPLRCCDMHMWRCVSNPHTQHTHTQVLWLSWWWLLLLLLLLFQNEIIYGAVLIHMTHYTQLYCRWLAGLVVWCVCECGACCPSHGFIHPTRC